MIKRVLICLTTIMLTLSLCVMIASCKGCNGCNGNEPYKDDRITLNFNMLTLYVGQEKELIVSTKLEGDIIWSSSDENVVVVNNGKVLGVSEGFADITASIGEKSATCSVDVFSGEAVLGCRIKFDKSTLTLYKGGNNSYQLSTVVYDNDNVVDYPVEYSSTAENIANVDQTGLITAMAFGQAEIIAKVTAPSGDIATARCIVNVNEQSNLEFVGKDYLMQNSTIDIEVDFKNNLGQDLDKSQIVWSVKDTSIASIDNNGCLYGIKEGSTKVIADVFGEKYELAVVICRPISTVYELLNLNNQKGFYMLENDILVDDLNSWKVGKFPFVNPLSNVAKAYTLINSFGGYLNGNGYAIKINVNNTQTDAPFSGVFGKVEETSVIKNVKFDISINANYNWSPYFAGVFAGKLQNCYIKTELKNKATVKTEVKERTPIIVQLTGDIENNIFNTTAPMIYGYYSMAKQGMMHDCIIIATGDYPFGYTNYGGQAALGRAENTQNIYQYSSLDNVANAVDGKKITVERYESGGVEKNKFVYTTTSENYFNTFKTNGVWGYDQVKKEITLCGRKLSNFVIMIKDNLIDDDTIYNSNN